VKLNNVQLRFIKTNSFLVLVHVCEFTQSIIITEVQKYGDLSDLVHVCEFTQSIIITEVQKYGDLSDLVHVCEFTQSIISPDTQCMEIYQM